MALSAGKDTANWLGSINKDIITLCFGEMQRRMHSKREFAFQSSEKTLSCPTAVLS
jgi:hypothetical protein